MKRHRLMFVDDEENILKALLRLFHEESYETITATSGEEALKKLNGGQVSLVISDQRMPGMQGVELLKHIKEISPDTICILLTGHTDIQTTIGAINSGAIYKYVDKPWDDEQCRITVKRALEQYDLIQETRRLTSTIHDQNIKLKYLNENLKDKVEEKTREVLQRNDRLKELNRQLQKNFIDTTKVFAGLMEMRDEYIGGHSKRVAVASKELAIIYHLSAGDVFDIEVAALLHDLGKMGLRDSALTVSNVGAYDKDLREVQEQHAIMGQMALAGVEDLEEATKMIRHHHENYDGTGVPDGLKGEDIPLGSRIIAVVDTFDGLRFRRDAAKSFSEKVVRFSLQKLAGSRLDPDVVKKFFDFLEDLRAREESKDVTIISADGLKEDMVIARDIITENNMLLVARGEEIKQSYLKTIRYYVERGVIQDHFYIYHSEKTDEAVQSVPQER